MILNFIERVTLSNTYRKREREREREREESPQVSRTVHTILIDLNNAVVLMVSTRPLISKSCNPFTNHLVTVPKEPITIGIIITFMFHRFFNSLARSRYLSFFSLSFNFTLFMDSNVHNSASIFSLIIITSGRD